MYLQSRMHLKGSIAIRPMLQMLAILLALAVCLTRVSDYKHHWSDVLAGGFLGTVVAFLTVIISEFKYYVYIMHMAHR